MELKQQALWVHKKLLDHFGQPEWRDPLPAFG